MSSPLRIGDLTRIAFPEQPALSPDGTRCAYVLRELDAERGPRQAVGLVRRPRRRAAAPAHERAGRLGARLVAGRRVDRLPACDRRPGPGLAPPRRRGRAVAAHRAAARRRRAPLEPRRLPDRVRGADRPHTGARAADRHRSPRLPRGRRRLSAHRAHAPLRARAGDEGVQAGDARRLARRRPGVVARRDAARIRSRDGSRRRSPLPRAGLRARRLVGDGRAGARRPRRRHRRRRDLEPPGRRADRGRLGRRPARSRRPAAGAARRRGT